MDKHHLSVLYKKFLEGSIHPDELQQLWKQFDANGDINTLQFFIEEELRKEPPVAWEDLPENQVVFNRVETALLNKINHPSSKPSPLYRRWYPYAGIAASLLIMLGIFWYNSSEQTNYPVVKNELLHDAAPGISKAVLTLADGSTVNLQENGNREIAKQGDVTIREAGSGSLVYQSNQEVQSGVALNTITTPNGGEYKITLSDGTKVWLNAATSLHYPVSFSGADRKVILQGEAYFEVAKSTKPFIVFSHEQSVQVLGTHFNVKNYQGESPVTTLLEGSVKVTPAANVAPRILLPGQQAVLTKNLLVSNGDVEQAIAWKNGFFSFKDHSLKYALKQMERWYDVEVDYTNVPDIELIGTVPRNRRLSSVLKALEVTTNIKFKIEERRISIMK